MTISTEALRLLLILSQESEIAQLEALSLA